MSHRKVRPMTKKRSARIAMGWKRILSQKRPAAGGGAYERDSFLYQDWGRRLDPAQSRGWVLHFRGEKVISAQSMREILHF